MRRDGLSVLVLAGLLGPACILDQFNHDDDGADSDVAATSESSSTTAVEACETTVHASTAADESAGSSACGWGPTGDPAVPEGYVCGGDGEDPSGRLPMLCPDAVELEPGGACGDIAGSGCCDAVGDAWFCGDAGRGPALTRIPC